MDDCKIIELFERRDEGAIVECQKQYSKLCTAIALHILGNPEDAEECVNDALLNLWNSIPPQKPSSLQAYLTVLVRNRAIDRYRYNQKKSRVTSEATVAFHEIEAVFPEAVTEDHTDELLLKDRVNRFLASLSERDRRVFLCRYYYFTPTRQIARSLHTTEAYVRVVLARVLKKFKQFLEKENDQ